MNEVHRDVSSRGDHRSREVARQLDFGLIRNTSETSICPIERFSNSLSSLLAGSESVIRSQNIESRKNLAQSLWQSCLRRINGADDFEIAEIYLRKIEKSIFHIGKSDSLTDISDFVLYSLIENKEAGFPPLISNTLLLNCSDNLLNSSEFSKLLKKKISYEVAALYRDIYNNQRGSNSSNYEDSDRAVQQERFELHTQRIEELFNFCSWDKLRHLMRSIFTHQTSNSLDLGNNVTDSGLIFVKALKCHFKQSLALGRSDLWNMRFISSYVEALENTDLLDYSRNQFLAEGVLGYQKDDIRHQGLIEKTLEAYSFKSSRCLLIFLERESTDLSRFTPDYDEPLKLIERKVADTLTKWAIDKALVMEKNIIKAVDLDLQEIKEVAKTAKTFLPADSAHWNYLAIAFTRLALRFSAKDSHLLEKLHCLLSVLPQKEVSYCMRELKPVYSTALKVLIRDFNKVIDKLKVDGLKCVDFDFINDLRNKHGIVNFFRCFVKTPAVQSIPGKYLEHQYLQSLVTLDEEKNTTKFDWGNAFRMLLAHEELWGQFGGQKYDLKERIKLIEAGPSVLDIENIIEQFDELVMQSGEIFLKDLDMQKASDLLPAAFALSFLKTSPFSNLTIKAAKSLSNLYYNRDFAQQELFNHIIEAAERYHKNPSSENLVALKEIYYSPEFLSWERVNSLNLVSDKFQTELEQYA